MKVVVTGNCQARPLATLLQRLPDVKVLGTFLIHLSKDAERAAHEAAIDQADVVFAQLTFGATWPEPVRSDYLKQTYPEKTVIWPNIYFRGQQPYLHYCRIPGLGLLSGPLTDYHDLGFLRDWFADRQGVPFADQITQKGYTETVTQTSLLELQQREQACDVAVSDLITETCRARRLFFTFNHPGLWLLSRLCERVLARIGQSASIAPTDMKEPLGRIRPPSVLAHLDAPEAEYQGVSVNLDTPSKIATGPVRRYTPEELRQTTFACYDHMQAHMRPEALKLSP